MTCYSGEGLSKPLARISASFVGAERPLIISFCIVWLLWDCDIEFFHTLRWSGFGQTIFVIWWWFLSSVLRILLEAKLFEGPCVSLCCGLCGERGMLGFSRTFGRCRRWCEISFVSMFLFGLIVQTFLNLILGV